MDTIKLDVFGLVQGVGFRYNVVNYAKKLHLSGWVRNNPDGSVSSVVTGEKERLDSFVTLVINHPPIFSKISSYEQHIINPPIKFDAFKIIYD